MCPSRWGHPARSPWRPFSWLCQLLGVSPPSPLQALNLPAGPRAPRHVGFVPSRPHPCPVAARQPPRLGASARIPFCASAAGLRCRRVLKACGVPVRSRRIRPPFRLAFWTALLRHSVSVVFRGGEVVINRITEFKRRIKSWCLGR